MKHFGILLFFSAMSILFSCQQPPKSIDIQGHRGARGLMPENTLPSFRKALELGVNTLEMDVVINVDDEVVVSHEPYFSHEITTTPSGESLDPTEEKQHNIYQMKQAEIARFDVGMKAHPRFPKQQKMPVSKPLMGEVLELGKAHADSTGRSVYYNIEIKSTVAGDTAYHPSPAAFSDVVVRAIRSHVPDSLVTLQSFDLRVLQYLRQQYPSFTLALLVENKKSIPENLKALGFIPEIYSCEYLLLDKEKIAYLHGEGMKVVPWTINRVDDMRQLVAWGVDGIITDYPDRAIQTFGVQRF